MRTELSYSRYNRHVVVSGSAVANFRSILISPLVGGRVPFRCRQIWRKIIQYHKETVYIHVVNYLKSRVRVVNAGTFEQCRVTSDGHFLVTHVYRQALAKNLSTVHIHGDVGQIVMAEIIRVRISRTENVSVFTMVNIRRFRSISNTALLLDIA